MQAQAGIKRTSKLHAPIMQLRGHGGEIYTLKFSPDGQSCASGSFDRKIYFWRVYSEDCANYMMLQVGATGALLPLLPLPSTVVHVHQHNGAAGCRPIATPSSLYTTAPFAPPLPWRLRLTAAVRPVRSLFLFLPQLDLTSARPVCTF